MSLLVGRLLLEDGNLVLRSTPATDYELERHPEHAIGVLLSAIWIQSLVIMHSADATEPPDSLFKFLLDWVYVEPRLESRKRGRPIKTRHTAIKALFYKEYFKKTWNEVTQRLCQCGASHDDKLTLKLCQDNIESQVRRLKKLLKTLDINYPPPHPTEPQPTYEAVNQEQPGIRTLEESHGDLWKPRTPASQHTAIALLLDGGPLPTIPTDSEALFDESGDLYRFNPWVPGWVPVWFPYLIRRQTVPIEIVSLTPQERLDRFDKMFNEVFKKFTGSPWSLVGSLDSPQQAVANTLLRMYRETRAEDMFVLDELKPVTF